MTRQNAAIKVFIFAMVTSIRLMKSAAPKIQGHILFPLAFLVYSLSHAFAWMLQPLVLLALIRMHTGT